jgi:hypothetical protein
MRHVDWLRPLVSPGAIALGLILTACGGNDANTTSEATGTSVTTVQTTSTTGGATPAVGGATPAVAEASPAGGAPPAVGRAAPPVGEATPTGGEEACAPPGNSPSRFDAERGQYAVNLTALDVGRRTVAFDVIQLLTGEDAARAYLRDFPDEAEAPDGFYTVNESRQVRESPVADDVRVRLLRLHEDSNADLDAATFEELPKYLAVDKPQDEAGLSYNPFWLTFRNSKVTEICEQYVP